MGAATSIADRVVLTSDNPRSEDPGAIADAIASGVTDRSRVTIELDRRRAIRTAILEAGERDVVLVAGKGPSGAARGRPSPALRRWGRGPSGAGGLRRALAPVTTQNGTTWSEQPDMVDMK